MPLRPLYDTIDLELLINGENSNLHISIRSISVEYEVNRIPYAKIDLTEAGHLQINENGLANAFALDDDIEIKIREEGEMKTLFKGIIQNIKKIVGPHGFQVQLECMDMVSKLLATQEIWVNENFEDTFHRFLNHYSINYNIDLQSLGQEEVSMVDNLSPWDFIISYLDMVGLLTTIKNGEFSAILGSQPDGNVIELQLGANIFNLEYTRSNTVASVKVENWNMSQQALETVEVDTEVEGAEGIELNDLGHSYLSAEILQKIAQARATKNRLSTLWGRVKTFGNLRANYGDFIVFKETGEELEEKSLLITAEIHTINQEGWKTEYAFGLENNEPYAEGVSFLQNNYGNSLGQMNAISGLQIGIVTDIENDPKGQYRVQVRITSIMDTEEGYWARLSSLQAGNNRGGFFIPEIGDEVVVGFFNDNPNAPVVLGALYSDVNPAPFDLQNENYVQGIVTREGSQLVFDDEKKSISIKTAGGNSILISDDESGIILEDQNGNKITMGSSGISIESAGDLNLKAAMNAKIEGVQNTMEASGIIKIKGSLIQLN